MAEGMSPRSDPATSTTAQASEARYLEAVTPIAGLPDLIERAIEDERARTRAWLHDTALQVLDLVTARGRDGSADPRELARLAAGAAAKLRRYVEGEGVESNSDLLEGLQRLVSDAQLGSMSEITLVRGPDDGSLSSEVATALVAAAGEALHNAEKHARAGSVVVYVEAELGRALVSVRDDGVGFDPTGPWEGHGLRHSIHDRLERIGCRARVESRPGEGTLVLLEVPARREAAA